MPIQLLKPKDQTISITETSERKPAKPEFRSIFNLSWGNSDTVQLMMDSGASRIQTPLVTDHLNVVGEDHIQSQGRREQEKKYCRDHSKSSQYWRESKFKDSDGKFGDPIKDRIHFGLTGLQFQAQYIIKDAFFILTNYDRMSNNDEKKSSWGRLMKKLIQSRSLLQGIWELMKDLELGKVDADFKGKEQEKKDLLDLIPQFKTVGARWQDTYKANYDLAFSSGFQHFHQPRELEFDWTQEIQAVTTQQNSLINYKIGINTLINSLIQKGWSDKTTEQISEARSDSIHNMANKCHEIKGVWKIGDKHVEHIKNKYPHRKYELISQDKFNEIFIRSIQISTQISHRKNRKQLTRMNSEK